MTKSKARCVEVHLQHRRETTLAVTTTSDDAIIEVTRQAAALTNVLTALLLVDVETKTAPTTVVENAHRCRQSAAGVIATVAPTDVEVIGGIGSRDSSNI